MAVVVIDGFDAYNGIQANIGLAAKWTLVNSSRVTMQAGRFGGQAIRMSGAVGAAPGTAIAFRSLPAAVAAAGVGFGFNLVNRGQISATQTQNLFMYLADNAGVPQVGIGVSNDGSIGAYRVTAAGTGTLLGAVSAPDVILDNSWCFIEVAAAISDTVGTVVVKVNGDTILNLSAQDTRNGVPTTVQRLYLQGPSTVTVNDGPNFFFDDLYITDTAATLGQRRVETLYPTADVVGAKDFTPLTGTDNYAMVDETTVNITDYVSGSTIGNVDRYEFGNLAGTPTSIDAVQVNAYALKTDASVRSIAIQAKSGVTTSDGPNLALATTYAKNERLMLTDPNGSIAWTKAAVDALQAGVKVTV